jgi:hypothetical protein
MRPSDTDDVPALAPRAAALVDLARSSVGSMSLSQRSRGLVRVEARVARGSGIRVPRWAALVLAIGLTAALLFAGRSSLRPRRSPVLAYAIDGEPAAPGTPVIAEGDRRPIVHFSDGTEVALGAHARARVTAVTEHGAQFALERGEVSARVVHWAGSRWLFDAGPFLVTVTGTTFWVSWSPEDQRFDLKLEDGSLAVSAPVSAEPIALRAGQWLTIRMRSREILIRDLAAAVPTEDSVDAGSIPAPPTEGSGDAGSTPEPEPRPANPPSEHQRDWAAKLAAGKLQDILAEAQRWGIDACLAEATSSELSALADAARYTRDASLARRTLLAQRRRFAGSGRAAEAAFLLGRLTEAGDGAAALAWFDRYLGEAPAGAYASEALGRKMLLVQRISGDASAAVVAQEYVRRFPKGTYARSARTLLGGP